MNTEIVRKLDDLGRIVLPADIRKVMGWSDYSSISISRQDNQVILRTYEDKCFVCGSKENIHPFKQKYICQNCIDEIKNS